jgi:hypothetical protein
MRRFCRTGEHLPAHCMMCSGAWGAPQRKKGKGKAKAGSSGAGGGPSTKAAAAAGSSGEGSSSQGSSRPSAPPARIIGLSTEEPAVQVAEAAQQIQPQPAGGGSTKADKERQRKERQRHRKIEEASEALDRAMARMAERAGSVEAVEEAMRAAEKHEGRSEPLAALVAEAKGMVEQARAAEAERARVAAEAAAAAAAEAAAGRQQMEHELAALTLSVQSETLRMQAMQAQLGVPPAAPAPQPDAEETMCVVCFDAPKQYAMLPCLHMCACEACAQQLLQLHHRCPVCRAPIERVGQVFT